MSSIIKIGDIVEFQHLAHSNKHQGVVIEISGEYCYICFFDSDFNFGSSIPFHYSSLTKISS
jgi:hypothetical protein